MYLNDWHDFKVSVKTNESLNIFVTKPKLKFDLKKLI